MAAQLSAITIPSAAIFFSTQANPQPFAPSLHASVQEHAHGSTATPQKQTPVPPSKAPHSQCHPLLWLALRPTAQAKTLTLTPQL